MSMKVGDKVQFIDRYIYYPNNAITGNHALDLHGLNCKILKIYKEGFSGMTVFSVLFDDPFVTKELNFYEYKFKELDSTQDQSPSNKCDCGGFKTFGSMSPENHSSWCSSRQTPKVGFIPIDKEILVNTSLGSTGQFISKGFKI